MVQLAWKYNVFLALDGVSVHSSLSEGYKLLPLSVPPSKSGWVGVETAVNLSNFHLLDAT